MLRLLWRVYFHILQGRKSCRKGSQRAPLLELKRPVATLNYSRSIYDYSLPFP
ncbi:hypothetical protein ASPCADRAFT_205177, partial [Aspergillus carbonarius ITEM 5010]